ncbi:MAG: transaldolase [Candidatus Omnitrophota bacterium]
MTQSVQNPIRQVLDFGQSIWFDGLAPKEEFERMIREDGIRGATTNPTIFEKAISEHTQDAEWMQYVRTHSPEDIYKKIAVQSVRELADLFQSVYEETSGQDGFVSIEVSPLLAYDTESTVREARELWELVGRKNVMVKVPATAEGVPAIETLIAEGINVNVTLIFSLDRYRQVMDAYLRGLERRDLNEYPVSRVASVASFFVSRVDTAADKLIEEKLKTSQNLAEQETLKGLLGKTAIANSKRAYAEFEKVFSGRKFGKLKEKGARVQRPLWASTGTKNPVYRDVLYVEALIGPQTVNTLPPATFAAFRDHGVVVPRLQQGAREMDRALRQLKRAGISLKDITARLEAAGVELFSDSYKKIIQFIGTKK